ncbi:MAG: hypothetical protein ACXWDL_05780 [Nocardioides sp.]
MASLLLLIGSGSATAGDGTMSVDRAGNYYLKHACISNAANDRFFKRVWRGQRTISVAEVRRRLPQIKDESTRVGRANHTWSRRMYNPPAAWPSGVTGLVDKLAARSAREGALRLAQGRVETARGWMRLNGRVNRISGGSLASRIRAKLDLPPAGEGC